MQVILAVVSAIALYLLRRPPRQDPPPTNLDQLEVPKAEQGDEIGRVYGTIWMTDPQVAWFGDRRAAAVKKRGGKK